MGFVDSYSYAISGYTTAEVSLIIIPFLVIAVSKLLGIQYDERDIVTSTALAYGISITTTLTSGMYITYGFLDYISSRLKAYGLAVEVPEYLFSGVIPDYLSLPVYVSLALISFGGVLVAYAFRSHFIEKERLKYPIGFASAILTKVLGKTYLTPKLAIIAIGLGFLLQLMAMRIELFLDLTPVASSVLPGAVVAISFWPMVAGLLFIIPLDPLKMISLGSISTYLIMIPLSIALFDLKVVPALNFEDALFSYSSVIVGLIAGVVVVFLTFYIMLYAKILTTTTTMIFKLRMERTMFIFGVALIAMLGYIAVLLSGNYSLIPFIVPLILLHLILLIANLRVVGEAGTGSQALLPLATFYMYLAGIRDVTTYAILDPYTGIPMPQVVGGSAMNLLRFARFFGCNIVKLVLYFGIGVFVGSFTTYIFGNILVGAYGFDSPYMPLTRWIPTTVFMSSIYSGKIGESSIAVVILGLVIGLALVLINMRVSIPLFPFVVGMTMPPDLGVVSFIVFLVKRILVKLGVEVHEKIIIFSILFLVGCGIAVLFNTILTLLTMVS